MKCKVLAVSAALSLLGTTGPLQAGGVEYSEAFAQQVEQYILDNPDIVLKALILLEEREEAAKLSKDAEAISRNAPKLFGEDMKSGAPYVTVFVDYQCGYCKMAEPQVIAAQGRLPSLNVRYVQFPILGEISTEAAKFAESVRLIYGEQLYSAMHEHLMTGDVREPGAFKKAAQEFDLNYGDLEAEMRGQAVEQKIRENHQLARALGITGTPGFVFPTKIIRGMANEQQIIDIATAETSRVCSEDNGCVLR